MLKFVFLVGRTLIDERNYYSFIDSRLLYLLNQLGVKIDYRNYIAIKNDIIQNRKLSSDKVEEFVIRICMALMPKGYEKIILRYIHPSIEFAEKHLLYPCDDAMITIEALAKNFNIGIIGSHVREISDMLKIYELNRFIYCCVLTYNGNEPDRKIFNLILKMLDIKPCETLFIGDRLDTHIRLANSLGMVSIRLCKSIFKLQRAANPSEVPVLILKELKELADTDYVVKEN